jgi:hypothetical protein
MSECFICGAAIARGGSIRKRVYTGSSVGGLNLSSSIVLNWMANSIISKRRPTIRSYYSYRTVCPSCSASLDDWERKKRLAALAVISIVLAIGVYATLSH